MNKMPDIYFTPEYGRIYEKHEKGTLEVFTYACDSGKISCQFIRRSLAQFEGYEAWADIITPYGYGGPVILDRVEGEKEALIQGFKDSFSEYCHDHKIVSFFIRFHPIIRNDEDFKPIFDEVTAIRKIVVTDLTKDLLHEEIDKKALQTFRRMQRKNLVYEYDPACKLCGLFHEMYTQTMDKNHASEYYYFSPGYFYDLKKQLGDAMEMHAVKLEDRYLNLFISFSYGDFVHGHLTASTPEGYKMSAEEFNIINIILGSAERGYKWMLHGGGVTNDPDDSLFRYKKKFSRSAPYEFFIGKHVFDREFTADFAGSRKNKKAVSWTAVSFLCTGPESRANLWVHFSNLTCGDNRCKREFYMWLPWKVTSKLFMYPI